MTDLLDLIAAAQARATTGMQRAEDHAGPDWSIAAFEALIEYAAKNPEPFTAEQARASMIDAGLARPPDARAWGGVFKRAAARGHICFTGNYAPRLCGNMTPTMLWRAA